MASYILPQGSGDGQSPEEPQEVLSAEERAAVQYLRRIGMFETVMELKLFGRSPKRRRRTLNDYTAKNCEEAYGGRP